MSSPQNIETKNQQPAGRAQDQTNKHQDRQALATPDPTSKTNSQAVLSQIQSPTQPSSPSESSRRDTSDESYKSNSSSTTRSSISRKRSRSITKEQEAEESTMKNHRHDPYRPPQIQKLCLEAIFHPKFENENLSDQQIRQKMLSNVSSSTSKDDKERGGKGHLEVSLKHSGSLLMWSGGQRYYSKNSTDNVFTGVGEILLRQHFIRAWSDSSTSTSNSEQKYKECTAYLQAHRLTLSFEVVTSVLGHHGAIPHKDYMILLAVADRTTGTFFATNELLTFAQRFRLPHNDTWIFQTEESARKLFDLYDSSREEGLADSVVDTLNKNADGHVESLCNHCIFQGNVLEGIVIRYVPYREYSDGHHRSVSDMETLHSQSKELLKLVPPDKTIMIGKDSTLKITDQNHSVSVLCATDVREVRHNHPSDQAFAREIENILHNMDKGNRRKITRTTDLITNHEKEQGRGSRILMDLQQMNIPKMAVELLKRSRLQSKIDIETKKLARLIEIIDNIGIAVDYNVMCEDEEKEELDASGGDVCVKRSKQRYICIVHVRHDASHQKYHKATCNMTEEIMMLYRGFSFQILLDDESGAILSRGKDGEEVSKDLKEQMDNVSLVSQKVFDKDIHGGKLMLKMKFLPYMVRTFVCRNGLSIISKSGPNAFNRYALNQLKKWDMSENAMSKWMPFFHGWGKYCEPLLRTSKSKSSSLNENKLPPLTSQWYLFHYRHYEDLLKAGKVQTNHKSSSFNGLLVLVGVDQKNIIELAKLMAAELNCQRVLEDSSTINKDTMVESMSGEGGTICCTTIVEGFGKFRKMKENKSNLFIVLVGSTEIDLSLDESAGPILRRTKGMVKGWKKTECGGMIEISLDVVRKIEEHGIKECESLVNLINTMKNSAVPKSDDEPGMLVFFPGIPGSGKSSLCKDVTVNSLKIDSERKLIVKVGDQVKGKFYPLVTKEKRKDPSSVYIVDKNVPPVSWTSVENICLDSNGVAVPIVPDDLAFCDTTIASTYENKYGTKVNAKQVYPFSLHYLAVCMNRVLLRKPNTHGGKLDSGTDTACMIVVKFYVLYKNYTANQMIERLKQLGNINGDNPVVTIPFFDKKKIANLPADLEDVLHEAINLQCAIDARGPKRTKNDCAEMEKRLRDSLRLNREFLTNLTVEEATSRDAFASQISSYVFNLKDRNASRVEGAKNGRLKKITLVFIDVEYNCVHDILKTYCSKFLKSGPLEAMSESKPHEEKGFIQNVHVTMIHPTQANQTQMRLKFGNIVGMATEVKVLSLMFNDQIAALEVEVASSTKSAPPLVVPRPMNDFSHITVWCAEGVSAYKSNKLPKWLEKGKAQQIKLETPITLRGEIKYRF